MKEIDKLSRLLEETRNLLEGFSSGSLSPISSYNSDDFEITNNTSFDSNERKKIKKKASLKEKLDQAEAEDQNREYSDHHNWSEFKSILQSGKVDNLVAYVESNDFVKTWALHSAVDAGCLDLEIFKALLRAGCDPLKVDSQDRTALTRFSESKKFDSSADCLISTLLGEWELRRAATAASKLFKFIHSNNPAGLVAHLNQHFPQNVATKLLSKADPKYAGISPLHEIAALNATQVLSEILSVYPNVDLNSKAMGSGNTPLHEACHMSALEMVKLLLENGAREDIKNVAGRLAAHLGTEKIQVVMEIRNMMMASKKKDDKNNDSNNANNHSNNSDVTNNVTNNVNNNGNKIIDGVELQRDPHTGRTILHRYARRNHYDKLIKFLDENGMVTDGSIRASKVFEVIDNSGHCPLYEAASEGSLQVLKLFLFGRQGEVQNATRCLVDPSIAAEMTGDTPLHAAAQSGNEDIVTVLLAAGADKNARNIDGKRPIDLTKSKSIKKLLLDGETGTEESVKDKKRSSSRSRSSSSNSNSNSNSSIKIEELTRTDPLIPVKRGPGRPRKYPLSDDQLKQRREKKTAATVAVKISETATINTAVLPLREIINDDCVLLVRLSEDLNSDAPWCLLYDQYRAIYNHLAGCAPRIEPLRIGPEEESIIYALPRYGRLVDLLQSSLAGGLIEKSVALRSLEKDFNCHFNGPFGYIDTHRLGRLVSRRPGFPLKAKLKLDKTSSIGEDKLDNHHNDYVNYDNHRDGFDGLDFYGNYPLKSPKMLQM